MERNKLWYTLISNFQKKLEKNLFVYEKTLTLQNFSQSCIQMVPWMSGLVSGLQNHVGRFDSARYLKRRASLMLGVFDFQ